MKTITDEQLRHYFNANFEGLFVYAFTLVKDGAEAKDIAQASFLKLWEKRNDITLERSVRAFLYTTVYHLALNAIKKKKIYSSIMNN